MSAIEPEARVTSFAYFNFINFIFSFLGATFGGWLAPYMPILAHHQLQTIFAISALLRIVPAMIFQFLQEEKYEAKMTLLERFFFDPTVSVFTGVSRVIPRRNKHQT